MPDKARVHDASCDDAPDLEVKRATSMSVGSCDCGSVSVLFHDAQGRVFATGTLDLNGAIDFTDSWTAEIQKRLDEALARRGVTVSSEVH